MAARERIRCQDRDPVLSGYRIMWLIVLFDLPVVTKPQRRAATRFRLGLLDEGFEMTQYSVYLRHCVGKEKADALARRIELIMPEEGRIHMIQITDKQYENIRTFRGRKREPRSRNPDQLIIF